MLRNSGLKGRILTAHKPTKRNLPETHKHKHENFNYLLFCVMSCCKKRTPIERVSELGAEVNIGTLDGKGGGGTTSTTLYDVIPHKTNSLFVQVTL